MRSTGPDKGTRKLIWDRGSGRCERCGHRPGEQIHHRKPRGSGGTRDAQINSPSNLMLICLPCHSLIENNRARAYECGWLVHRWDDPRQTSVSIQGHYKFLTEDGGYEPVPLPGM